MKWLTSPLPTYRKSLLTAVTISLASMVLTVSPGSAEEVDDLAKSFRQFYQVGDFKQMIPTGARLVEAIKAKYGEGHEKHIKTLDRFANAFFLMAANQKAEALYKKALELAQTKHGKDSKWALEQHSSLGVLYRSLNKNEEAIAHFKEASAIAEKLYGASNLETRVMKSNLALLQK